MRNKEIFNSHILRRMKVVNGDARFSMFMKICEWFVRDIDLANELFVPDWEEVKNAG